MAVGERNGPQPDDTPSSGEDVVPASSDAPVPARRKTLAKLEKVNRNPSLVSRLRGLRRALPGDPSFGDPLSTAGPGSARALARVADRFLDDQPGASREVSLGALQVWQAALERIGRGRGTHEVTIVFTDLVGFSSWSLPAGDDATLELLKAVARAVENPFRDRGGYVVKRLGDGVMAVFPSPDRALEAVFEARESLDQVDIDGYRPRMRVGIHTGVPRKVGDDWLGVDVTIAARMMQLGGDGNVVMSETSRAALQFGTAEQLDLDIRPWRKPLFGSSPNGVPPELGIWRVRRN
ncbi:MAG: adenylate/guanylate cyclase domain-containing protein [Rhodococcus sp.]|nr:adenylate/guanylate cyclase domain-containing protein [Rhodococcus sp. (in: high G+C Gram-positive bacteria)]